MNPPISYVGKCLLIIHESERVLVLGDLHLGYEAALRGSGYFIPSNLIEKTLDDLEKLFAKTGPVDRVILLGDVKHLFSYIDRDERSEIGRVFTLLERFSKNIIIVKGNHDTILRPLVEGTHVSLVDYYVLGSIAFVHGDKDYTFLHEKNITTWVMGHFHPAVTLKDAIKQETYKCFLHGKYEGKSVYLVPSFFSAHEGTDPRDFVIDSVWAFPIERFNVIVVGENLETYEFGPLKKIYR